MTRSTTLVLVLSLGTTVSLAAEPNEDEKAVRRVAERYFAAYAAKDLDALMALWGRGAPEAATIRENLKAVFVETGPIQVKELTVVRTSVRDGEADVRVRMELIGNDARSGKPYPGFGKIDRVLSLRKKEDAWKVHRYEPAQAALVRALGGTEDRRERERLLQADKDLIDGPLVLALLSEGHEREQQGQSAAAARLQEMAFEIAERLHDNASRGWCHLARGVSQVRQSHPEAALASWQRALALFRAAKERRGEAVALYRLGLFQARRSQFEEARKLLQENLRLVRELRDRRAEADALKMLGFVAQQMGRSEEALEYCQQYLLMARQLGDRLGEAQALGYLGALCLTLGRHAEALGYYRDSLPLLRDLKQKADEGLTLRALAVIYGKLDRHKEGLPPCRDALKIARQLRDRAAEAHALSILGDLFLELGRRDEALSSYRESLAIARESRDRVAEAGRLKNLGRTYRLLHRYEEALRHYQDSLALYRDLKRRADEAAVLRALGALCGSMGRNAEALRYCEDGLKIARDLGDRPGEASALSDLGNVCHSLGRYEEALRHFQASLALYRDLKQRANEADVLLNLGNVHGTRGLYAEAMRFYEESLTIARALGHRAGESRALGNLGLMLRSLGRYREALRHHEDSLRIVRELGDRREEGQSLINIGGVYQSMGLFAESLRHYQDGLRIARDLKTRTEEATALGNIGQLYRGMGRVTEALRYQRECFDVFRAIGDQRGQALSLMEVGELGVAAASWGPALECFQESLRLFRELKARGGEAAALGNIGLVYQSTQRYPEALRQYEDARTIVRELGDRPGEAQVLFNIGAVYLLQDRHAEALRQFRDSLALAEPLGVWETTLRCHFGRGEIYYQQKKWPDAAEAFRQAIGHLEHLRADTREPLLQTSFFAQYTVPYVRLADCLREQGRPDEAFAVSERVKARTLVDILESGKVNVRKGMSEAQRRQEQQLQDQVIARTIQQEDKKADPRTRADRVARLDQARQDLDAFRRDLYLRRPEVRTLQGQFDSVSLKRLNRSLFADRPNAVLLSYLVSDEHTLLFVLRRGEQADGPARLAVHRIDLGAVAVADAVAAFRGCCVKSGIRPSSEELQPLLEPAREALRGASPLIVIPDGALHTLPFAALRLDEEGPYLVERCAVSYAPSVTALLKMAERGGALRARYGMEGDLLAVGIGAFGRRQPPLPAAEPEARAVAGLFGARARTLLGSEATRGRLGGAWGGRRYLHFATHGILNEKSPFYSAVLLSPADGDDGRLFARDLLDADLDAELAVLSACQTGLGRRERGEGVLGMTWAWLVAGVPATVASQWFVADESTARLMRVFYTELKTGTTKAEALRRAQVALLKERETRHPFHWAAFALTGDPW